MEQNTAITQIYNHAAEVIKSAILQGQYEALKGGKSHSACHILLDR